MTKPFQALAGLDRTIHEPARLAIMTALENLREADFLFLQRLTGLTKGNLSSHLVTLETAGLVKIDKGYAGKTPRTSVSLSAAGRSAVKRHWLQLSALRESASEWLNAEDADD